MSFCSDAAGLENSARRIEMGCESDGRRGESTEKTDNVAFTFIFVWITLYRQLLKVYIVSEIIFAHEKADWRNKITFFEHNRFAVPHCIEKGTGSN